MTNTDSSDDETESYYDSSDDDNSYLYIGDQIIEETPYCACCNILIDNNVSYLHCSNTNDYLCLNCFETAHITPETADEYEPIWSQ